MTRHATLKNVAATFATAAPVLAMVAGLATAHMLASATGITKQDTATGDHPRRIARTAALSAPATVDPTDFTTTKQRGVRAATRGSDTMLAQTGLDYAEPSTPSRARVMTRQ